MHNDIYELLNQLEIKKAECEKQKDEHEKLTAEYIRRHNELQQDYQIQKLYIDALKSRSTLSFWMSPEGILQCEVQRRQDTNLMDCLIAMALFALKSHIDISEMGKRLMVGELNPTCATPEWKDPQDSSQQAFSFSGTSQKAEG